jgi:transcriptional regulator with GAF, ATPase, and Fis domain
VESDSDIRFDSNHAALALLETAREQSLELLLKKLVDRAVERPEIACAQIWLMEKGDLCATCPQRPGCADQSRCLHLAAGNGISVARSPAPKYFDDPSSRMPLQTGLIGAAVTTREQCTEDNLRKNPDSMAGFDWLKREEIRRVSVTPILFKGETLGIIVAFTRRELPEGGKMWGRIFANHIGAAIANARAFEEIKQLKAQLELHNTYLLEEVAQANAFGDLIGQSAALRHIISQIDLVAPTEASVLILGDTGTGKELVAREIHRRSPRRDRPLVRVNCASIPKELFESEFFGHVKGSFTGAIKDRAGRFETAEGGTLFLDEIGEVPPDMQGKLLRALQEKRYERVGEDRTRQADVRVIAATNRDLKKEVAAGRFREDLYYRLNVFPIQVVPLRERQEDIPLLAKHFVELSVKELRCALPRLTRAGVTLLQNYDWPGNVRELRNVIQRAVILARGGPLNFDLPVTGFSPGPISMRPQAGAGAEGDFLTEAETQRRDRENLLTVLTKTSWKIKGADGAAELLGVKPTTLLARIKKMGLQRPD